MPIPSRREVLEPLARQEAGHAGLVLQRHLAAQGEQREQRERDAVRELLARAAAVRCGPAAAAAYRRWRAALGERPGCLLFTGAAAGPVAVGLGNESVLEVGLTLHHTYGIPVLPGSALKGLCRRGALRLLAEGKLEPAQADALFGTQDSAACCTFWDAWCDPASLGGRPLEPDVVTVHHPEYYGGGACWPSDFDDPNPVPFLAVRPGARFLFAVEAPGPTSGCPGWGEFAARLLQWSLENLGVGAKTNAGYGYFGAWQEAAAAPAPGRAVGGAGQPVLPAAAPEPAVWKGCALERRVDRGAVSVRIRCGERSVTIQQNVWQPLEAGFTAAQKEALKKGRLRADVTFTPGAPGVPAKVEPLPLEP